MVHLKANQIQRDVYHAEMRAQAAQAGSFISGTHKVKLPANRFKGSGHEGNGKETFFLLKNLGYPNLALRFFAVQTTDRACEISACAVGKITDCQPVGPGPRVQAPTRSTVVRTSFAALSVNRDVITLVLVWHTP